LTAFFRYLLPLYLIAALSLLVAAFFGQQHQHQQVLEALLQQYADTVQLSLKPTLGSLSSEQLSQRLAELQFSAVFPVATLALYQADGQLLAVAGAEQPLPAADQLLTFGQSRLQKINGRWLALQAIKSQALPFEQLGSASNLDLQLLIIPDTQPWQWQWQQQWPVLLALFWLSLLLWLAALLMRQQQRIQMRQLESVEQQLIAPEAESGSLATLSPTLQQRLQQHGAQSAELQQQLQRCSEQAAQAAVETVHWQSLHNALLQRQQQQQQCVNRWLMQVQLLWQRQEQLSPALFSALLNLQQHYARYQFGSVEAQPEPVQLASWLQQSLPALNSLLPDGSSLDWLEGSGNLTATLNVDPEQLFLLLQAMLALGLRSEAGRRFQFRVALDCSAPATLRLQLNCDGNGLPKHLARQVAEGKLTDLQWRDADIALLQLLTQRLQASSKIESLDGLGLSLSLNVSWPLPCEPLASENLPGSVLLFDADPERLSERLAALSGYTLQLSSCNSLSELQQRLVEQHYQLVILMLPGQIPGAEWQCFLQQLDTPFVAYAPPLSFNQWQQLVPCRPSAEFCLAAVPLLFTEATRFSRKKLLVVDDNETNQAFINVLIQQRLIELHAAHSAEQALSMCQQTQFDLILLDIQLPDLPGTEVAKRLRQLQHYRDIPILAFTAHALPAEIAAFKSAGMNDIVLKPLDPCQFDALLRSYRLY
jgi:CheY-like chemotaxis protein